MRRLATFVISAALFAFASGPAAWSESVPERLDRLESELAALKKSLASKPASAPGARGEAGPPGPPGPKGERGPAGSPEFPLILRNETGKNLVWLGRSGDHKAGFLYLANSTGQKTVEIVGGGPKSGFANFSDESGKRRIYLGTTKDGPGKLEFFGADGKSVIQLAETSAASGQILVNGSKVKDYAEVMEVATREGVTPGSVMAVAGPAGRIGLSSAPYDRRVVGVISGAGGLQPGSVIGSREDGTNDLPVAVSGQVYVRVSLEGGTIEPGDLLVASSRPGVAMRAAGATQSHGAVVGKALEAFGAGPAGEGLVRMMVMLR